MRSNARHHAWTGSPSSKRAQQRCARMVARTQGSQELFLPMLFLKFINYAFNFWLYNLTRNFSQHTTKPCFKISPWLYRWHNTLCHRPRIFGMHTSGDKLISPCCRKARTCLLHQYKRVSMVVSIARITPVLHPSTQEQRRSRLCSTQLKACFYRAWQALTRVHM